MRKGFTLIELLLSIGIISGLSSIVIVAVNPTENFAAAQDARRKSFARELKNAVIQYAIANSTYPTGVPEGEENAEQVCTYEVTDNLDCVNLDVLVPEYLVELERDAAEENPDFLGYTVYKSEGGFIIVESTHLGSTEGTGLAPDSTSPAIAITAPTKSSILSISDTTIQVTDDGGVTAANVTVDNSSTASTSSFDCTQTSSNQVDCTISIDSSGDLVIAATDDSSNSNTDSEAGYSIETSILTTGLIGYWNFDETSAGTFADLSGNDNDGTGMGSGGSNNTPQPSTDVPSLDFTNVRSLSFDGSDDYVDMGDPSSGIFDFGASQDFTVMAWVKTTDTGNWNNIVSKGNLAGWNSGTYWSIFTTGHAYLLMRIRGPSGSEFALNANDNSVNNGQWHHLAVSFDRDGNYEKYVDGVKDPFNDSLGSLGSISTSNSLVVGKDEGAAYLDGYSGLMDEVRIYNRVLTDEEIADIAAGEA